MFLLWLTLNVLEKYGFHLVTSYLYISPVTKILPLRLMPPMEATLAFPEPLADIMSFSLISLSGFTASA